jgi:hypothetical protein
MTINPAPPSVDMWAETNYSNSRPTSSRWTQPEPIPDATEPGAFPTAALPPPFRDMVRSVAANKQVPEDLPAMLGLAAISILAGPRVAISRGHGWVEPLTLYTVTAMESGTGKSPAEKDVTRPLRKIQKRIREEWQQVIDLEIDQLDVERARLALSAKDKAAERELERKIEDAKARPAPRILFGSDTTVEALAAGMSLNGDHGGIMDGEGEFFGILSGRYTGQIPNLGLALKAYDGDYYEVGRVMRQQRDMDRAILGLGLAVQPAVLSEAAKSKAMRERGLLARFIFSVPANILGTRAAEGAPYDAEAMERWAAALEHIAAIPLPLPDAEDFPALRLGSSARKLHIDFKSWMEPRLHPDDGELGDLPGWASKHIGRTLRVAGLLHLVAGYDITEDVSERAMESAIDIARWAIPHATTVFGWELAPTEAGDGQCQAILKAIRRKNMAGWATSREYHRGVKNQTWVKEGGILAVVKVLERLVEAGWLATDQRKDGAGRMTTMYRPHPSVVPDVSRAE